MKLIKIHNHGHIALESSMGSDIDIVNAARVSFNQESDSMDESAVGLINYLMKHRHGTPFEMVEFKFDVKAPIFVFREWHRHRLASINEMSGRYTELERLFYVPSPENIREQVGKPGSYKYQTITNEDKSNRIRRAIADGSNRSFDDYEEMLRLGVAKEVARLVLPVNTYSRMKWKTNFRSVMNFLSLRNDERAQQEIRDYAIAMHTLVAEVLPVSMSAFVDQGYVSP